MAKTTILTEPYREARAGAYRAEARRVLAGELSKKEYQGYRLGGTSLVYVENAAGDEIAGLDVTTGKGIEVLGESGWGTTYQTLGEALNDVLATLRRSVGLRADAPFPVAPKAAAPKAAAPKAAAPKAAQSILTEPYREDRDLAYRAEAIRVLAEELSKKEYQGYRLSGNYIIYVENTAGRLVSLDVLTDRGIEVRIQGGERTFYQTLGEALNDVLATLRRSVVGLPAAAPKAAAPAASADKFPHRPKGASPSYYYQVETPPFAIIIAPKCKVPYAAFRKRDNPTYKCIGGNPEGNKVYVEGYIGRDDLDVSGYVRQHMGDGILNNADFGKGVGPAQYMVGPFHAALVQNKDCPGTFSRKKASNAQQQKNYCYRTDAADAAWQSMEDRGVAVEVDESKLPETIASMGTRTVKAPIADLFTASPYAFPLKRQDRQVTDLKPKKLKIAVEVDTDRLIEEATATSPKRGLIYGEVKSVSSKEVSGKVTGIPLSLNIVQEISRQTILDLGITLWIDPDHEDAILNPAVYTHRPAQPYVPTPAALAEVDFSATDSDWVQKIVKFCSERYGLVTPREYVQSFIEAAAGNPTIKIAGAPKVQNPRRRRNPAEDKRTKATLAFLNDEGWD